MFYFIDGLKENNSRIEAILRPRPGLGIASIRFVTVGSSFFGKFKCFPLVAVPLPKDESSLKKIDLGGR